jgi:hypothetical protein
MIELSTPYKTRPIRFLELHLINGWQLKIYGISALRDRPPRDLVDAIKAVANSILPQPAATKDRYGVGFLYAHEGRNGGGYASVNWWLNENELNHYQYQAPADRLDDLQPIEKTGGTSACAWDLAVIAFEREAWLETVLTNDAGPDLDAYLQRQMNEDV